MTPQKDCDIIAPAVMDGGLKLQHILPALQHVVPVLAPDRHKGQAGVHLFNLPCYYLWSQNPEFFFSSQRYGLQKKKTVHISKNHFLLCFQFWEVTPTSLEMRCRQGSCDWRLSGVYGCTIFFCHLCVENGLDNSLHTLLLQVSYCLLPFLVPSKQGWCIKQLFLAISCNISQQRQLFLNFVKRFQTSDSVAL